MGNCCGNNKGTIGFDPRTPLQSGNEADVYITTTTGNSLKRISLQGCHWESLDTHEEAEGLILKIYIKKNCPTFTNEVRVMEKLRENHVMGIVLIHAYKLWRHPFILMERCPLGDLFQWVTSTREISIAMFWILTEQLISTIQKCHACQIVHTDIKLENVGVMAIDDFRLLDFGSAVILDNTPMYDSSLLAGSHHYTAPEVLSSPSIPARQLGCIDYWELGVLLYIVLTREYPFIGKTARFLEASIKSGVHPPWKNPDARTKLIDQLLEVNPKKRLSFDTVEDTSSWISNFQKIV